MLYADSNGSIATKNDAGTIYTYGAIASTSKVIVDTTATGTALTIATGVVTVTKTYHTVDTEAAAASDDLATISGGTAGQILIIATANSGRDVVVKHGTGNVYLTGAADFTLSDVRDKLMLLYVGTEWHEIGRGNNT